MVGLDLHRALFRGPQNLAIGAPEKNDRARVFGMMKRHIGGGFLFLFGNSFQLLRAAQNRPCGWKGIWRNDRPIFWAFYTPIPKFPDRTFTNRGKIHSLNTSKWPWRWLSARLPRVTERPAALSNPSLAPPPPPSNKKKRVGFPYRNLGVTVDEKRSQHEASLVPPIFKAILLIGAGNPRVEARS